MHYLIQVLALVVLVLCNAGIAWGEGYIYQGIYTRHMMPDKDYNEDNYARGIEFVHPQSGASIGAGTFVNSFGIPSWYYGIGKRYKVGSVTLGAYVLGVDGYEDHVRTMYNGWIYTPSGTVGIGWVKAIVLPGVINVGIELPLKL